MVLTANPFVHQTVMSSTGIRPVTSVPGTKPLMDLVEHFPISPVPSTGMTLVAGVPCAGSNDDAIARQIKTLTAENLILRRKAEDNLSTVLLEGKSFASPKPVVSNPHTLGRIYLLMLFRMTPVWNSNTFLLPWKEVSSLSPPLLLLVSVGLKKWQSSLVGHFLGRKVPFFTVQSTVFRIWDKFGITDVLSKEDGFYFFLVNKDDTYKRILDSGPWHIGGRLMVLKKLEPQMSFVKDHLMKIPIWVQFFNVPLEYWTAAGLSYVASAIGRPLYADSMIAKCKRLNNARVCVEIEVGVTLPLSFDLSFDNGKEVEIKVKYPWKLLQCLECLVFGHREAGCPKNHYAQVHTSTTNQVWAEKAGKSKEVGVGVFVAPASPSKVLRPQKGVQVSGSPHNIFAALEFIDLESDSTLGFLEPNGLVDAINISRTSRDDFLHVQTSTCGCFLF
ncbi:hypothetical protein RHSIM_Rhsim04G0192900 [Rhododendron simsii]|uniref:DUF4283 domain-containing protein n=1 Tax=Rhododendron simsii TaxID=118357 RepID=A0A834H020_RHOSS|nr:hypothetical protein RHSIM_Rhsim04G0192900 [Rhododendron simsii]